MRAGIRDPEVPATSTIWSPELECAPRARLAELQSEKVAAAFALLFQHSPFYRAKFEAAGLGPEAVRDVGDLTKVPVTRPEEWAADQASSPPWGTFSPLRQEDWLERGWMVFATSGTRADVPRAFRHTVFDRDMLTWQGARALYSMGARRGDIALNCSTYGASVAYWGLHYALNHMGIPVISGSGATSKRRAFMIDRYRPTLLLSTPSYALALGREMADLGMSPKDSSIRLLVCAGEPGACVLATKRRLEQLWGAKVNDDFGCTEVAMSPLGYTCEAQVGRADRVDPHVMEDQYVVEVLDPTNWLPVASGARGTLVVSNLFSEAQPILRYAMGDWLSLDTSPCACGRTHARVVGGLQGRSDELLKINGLKFFPATLEDAVRGLPEVGDEFIVEITRHDDSDSIAVTVEPPSPDAPLAALSEQRSRLKHALKTALGIDVEVVAVGHGSLPRTTAKAKRIFDRRPPIDSG